MKQKLLALAKKMGLLAKVKDGTVTADDWNAFAKAFQDAHEGVDLLAAIQEAQETPKLEKEQQDILAALFGGVEETATTQEPKGSEEEADTKEPVKKPVVAAKGATTAEILAGIKQLQEKVAKLEKDPEDSAPAGKIEPKNNPKGGMKVIPINSRVSSETHLFGIEHDFFGLDKPWNKIAATRQPQMADNKRRIAAFQNEFNTYAENFAAHLGDVITSGLAVDLKMESIDYTGFDGTGWGEQYIVRRQDALIAYLRSLPSVRIVFPVLYGVQNKQEMNNSFLTDFSQSFQAGKIFKGSHSVEPMVAEVFDVMYKHLFENMKTLESEYIGYLNREGSQPIKWSMIEWLMSQTLTKLNNEWNERRIRGYRISPVTSVAGHHMFASNGVIRQLWKYTEDFYIQPFTDLKLYTATTILSYIESLVEKVNQILPSLQGNWLYMNEKHVPWLLKKHRDTYGTDLDFNGSRLEVKNYSTFAGIKAVPNMGNSCMMWITMENNIELYENKAGEMAAFYFERELESLISASWWKEGVGAYMVGKKYADAAAIAASNRTNQYIFMTYPVLDLDAGATTADATANDRFVTAANAGATVFTDFVGASEGVVYRIECGSVTNATTIAKANKFSELTAAWIPTAVGDYLEVYWNATTSKFIEVRRLVTA